MEPISPYDQALQIIKQHPGTSGASGMAKLVLSLYNSMCGYSFAECVGSMDDRLTGVALRLVQNYAAHGETDDLRAAGKIIVDDLYPGLWEMGQAMSEAREATRQRWKREEEAREATELADAEKAFLSDASRRTIPLDAAEEMIESNDGKVSSQYYSAGDWRNKVVALDQVRSSIRENGAGLIYCQGECCTMLGVLLDGRLHYVHADYDARERYLASQGGNG